MYNEVNWFLRSLCIRIVGISEGVSHKYRVATEYVAN